MLLQIQSVDYVAKDGTHTQSARLPGYSGISGLDGELDAEEKKREDDLEAVFTRSCTNDSSFHSLAAEAFGQSAFGAHKRPALCSQYNLLGHHGTVLVKLFLAWDLC